MRARDAGTLLAAGLLCGALLAAGGPAPQAAAAVSAARAERPLSGAEREEAFRRLKERQNELKSVRVSVVQRRTHPLLAAEAVTEGTLLFKKPNLLRFELDKPEKTIIVLDGETMTIYHPERKEAERRDLRGDFATRAAAEFFATGMSLSLAELEKRFQVDMFREDRHVVLRLTPRSKWLARAIASISIYQDEGDAVPRRIVVRGSKGDRTETLLSSVMLNPPVRDDAFALRFGPSVRVRETGAPGGSPEDGP